MARLSFGQQLKRLREEKGFSQDQLGVASGVAARAIRTYEQEQRAPSAGNLFSLSKALGVKCSAFEDCVFEYDKQPGNDNKPKPAPKKKP